MESHPEERITLKEELNSTNVDVLDDDDVPPNRAQWSNKFQYILTLLGYSVGLGNFWRFPYVCQRNGGGAFLLPYVIVTLLLAMPLFFLEVTIGQFSRQGPIGAWGLCPLMKGIGFSMLSLASLIVPYYSMVFTWALYYLYKSFTTVLPWTTCGNNWNTPLCVTTGTLGGNISTEYNATELFSNMTIPKYATTGSLFNITTPGIASGNSSRGHTSAEEFWQYNVLGVSSGLDDQGAIQPHLLICWFLACLSMFLCMMRGIQSLGKVVYVTALLPYFLLTVMLIRSCMMPGAVDGILYYITPDFNRLMHTQVWLEALVQVFFSVGPAWGSLIVMASHNKSNNNVAWDSVLVVGLGELTSFFAGFVVFSTVGYLAQTVNLPVADVITSGPGIGFIIYPEAVSLLPVSQLWSVLFFLIILMMGVDSTFGNIETAIGCIEDLLPRRFHGRHLPTILAALFMLYVFLFGLAFTTNNYDIVNAETTISLRQSLRNDSIEYHTLMVFGGVYLFQLMDWYVAAYVCFVTALCECLVVGWLYGIRRFAVDVECMIGVRLPIIFKILCCIVIPVLLVLVLVLALIAYKPPTYGDYVYPEYATIIGWCIAMISIVPILVTMVVKVLTARGSLIERLRSTITPSREWQKCRKRHGATDSLPNSIKDNFFFIFSRE